MKHTQELSPEQESEAERLAVAITERVAAQILDMARFLVSKDATELFGQAELDLRDRVHDIGAAALETVLGEKKTATRAPASTAPIATTLPPSRVTGR